MYKYRYLAVIFVLALGITFQSCDSTSSDGNNLESLISNSTWYTSDVENSAEVYLEYNFGDSEVIAKAHTYPCDGGESYGVDTTSYEVIDDETMSIDGDEATVVDYSDDEINVEGENNDGETVAVRFVPSCQQLESN